MKKTTSIIASTVITGAMALHGSIANSQGPSLVHSGPSETIRPFQVHMSKADIEDLRKRVLETRWPDKETVGDQSQGAMLAKLQGLVDYWGKTYDWRKAEKKLNAFPQFITTIDGIDIHFIHVRSKERNAMPMIISHGWPGSVIELLKIIDPLTNPVAYGGKAEDAFDVVIPSLPGFGFSGKPTEAGWELDRIAKAWAVADESSWLQTLCCARW